MDPFVGLLNVSDFFCLFIRSINDHDGPTIADVLYEQLFQGVDEKVLDEPDPNNSARTLHVTVKKLRSENVSFRRWFPFIHMGS
jgi:hypothetical protein